MEYLQLIRKFLKDNWIYLLIILGIFILLWQPKINLKTTTSTKPEEQSKVSWFDDIPLTNDIQFKDESTIASSNNSDKKVTINQFQPSRKKIDKNELEQNRVLIRVECCRREPDLSGWSWLDDDRNEDMPYLDYVCKTLEQKVGAEYLYSDVERGVNLIMKSIEKVRSK